MVYKNLNVPLVLILALVYFLGGCQSVEPTVAGKNPAIAGAPELARVAHSDVKESLGEAIQIQEEIKVATPETFAVEKPKIQAHIDSHVETLAKAEKSAGASEKATVGVVQALDRVVKENDKLKAEDSATFWTRIAAYAAMALGTFGLVLSFKFPSIRPLAAAVFVMGLSAYIVVTYIKAIIIGAIVTAAIGLLVYAATHPELRAKFLAFFKKKPVVNPYGVADAAATAFALPPSGGTD